MMGTGQPSINSAQDTGAGAEGLRYFEMFLPHYDTLTGAGPVEAAP